MNETPRQRLLAEIPAAEHEVLLAGVSTTVLEGGDGPPLLLLHGPGASALQWVRVFGLLAATHRVIAPDLPGHGSSEVLEAPLDERRVLTWLGDLIDGTCDSPPTLVGDALGGAIAIRFARERGERLSGLVLHDSLGLAPFEPTPAFWAALQGFIGDPTVDTHDRLWRQCALDLDAIRAGMGDLWQPFEDYNLDRARTPSVMAALGELMNEFAVAPIDLEALAVPTALIWGRDDRATPVEVAQAASARYGWPLRVIERCGDASPIERPEAFVSALLALVARSGEAAA